MSCENEIGAARRLRQGGRGDDVPRVKGAEYRYFTRFLRNSSFPTVTEPSDTLSRIRIVLVRTSHPGNIGAAARAMLTMGLTRLVLVAPARFPDPGAVAFAAGAKEVLATTSVVETLDEALAGCALAIGLSARPREYAGRVLAIRAAASEAIEHAATGDVALVFGTEMSGLSNAELARCGIAATIPANDEFSSLNLAAAVQVAAYELRVTLGAGVVWSAPRFAAATHDEVESLYAHAQRTLTAMKFLRPEKPRRLMPRLRRLFGRARLEREEVNILRGILARVDEFIGRADKP
jgi:tRNA/rRNA methyltransferase